MQRRETDIGGIYSAGSGVDRISADDISIRINAPVTVNATDMKALFVI